MKTVFNFIIGIPIFCSFVISLVFIGIGVWETIEGITAILSGHLRTEMTPGVALFESLDAFLIGFLFLIFSIGFSQLFLSKTSFITKIVNTITPEWLKVENFTQLKLILWDTVLTTLVVVFIGIAFRRQGEYDWQIMIIPGSIFLIALSKFLIKAAKK